MNQNTLPALPEVPRGVLTVDCQGIPYADDKPEVIDGHSAQAIEIFINTELLIADSIARRSADHTQP